MAIPHIIAGVVGGCGRGITKTLADVKFNINGYKENDVTIYTEKYVEDNAGTYYKLKAGTHTTVAVNMAMKKKD